MTLGRAAAALLCGALVALSGCGGGSKGDPIPAAQSDRLIANIQAADQYSSDGRCTRAHTKVRDAQFVLTQVPTTVDKDVRQGIADGLDHLDSLIASQCQAPKNTQTDTTTTESQTQTTESTTTPTTTTPTTTTPTDTTLTTTTPTTTTPTTTTPTTTTPTTTTGGGNGGASPDGDAGNQG